MRSVRARRAAMIGTAALLLIAPSAALAHADPVTPAPAAPLPADLVTAIQRDLGLSPEQYLAKAESGQKLVGFANELRAKFPDNFAGAWLDPSGKPLIGLTDGKDADAARKAAEAAGYTVKDLPHSEKALQDQLAKANSWIAKLPAPLAGLVGGAVVDTVNNNLVLRVTNTAEIGGLQLPDFLDGVVLALSPALGSVAPAAVNNGGAPADALLGGDSYAAENKDGAFRCSLGFNGTDASGATVNISAGHCDPNRGAAGTSAASIAFQMPADGVFGPRFGTFARTNLDGHDFSVIRIDNDAAPRFQNNLVRVPRQAPLAITGTADPVVGAPVCKSGLTTGFSCGTINAVDQTVKVGQRTLRNGFSANICALEGDSGGTVVTGDRALGISSASNVGDMKYCEVASVVTTLMGDSPQLFATPINAIIGDNPGLKVRTS
ncbi:S1 family peptidase [Rhodococcus spelaei]|uniref:S1 family peptidase n=1 Tax=Rhodococcus spelaei TaxID=2546320 RepID=A0A541BA81_9NOCA|nr:S1 family peptidase [Rhodococcus spelaei]TQF69236.1 S1 family peptidase [Rhodococcus spelaei]